MSVKSDFKKNLKAFSKSLVDHVSTDDGQWAVKGFVDAFRNVYTISLDTKVVSKILEIHLLPKILEFSNNLGLAVVLAEHQNYYPDISFISKSDSNVKFAVDFKTTYRIPEKRWLCNGFTLGSHGKYFRERTSTKNIQFPYNDYSGHFCLGVIYDRMDQERINETRSYSLDDLHSITSVISNIEFFVAEKWKIAGDKRGSGNTANIGSIRRIEDIRKENGMFSKLGESWFDDYWINYGRITAGSPDGKMRKITSLEDFVHYRGGDAKLIVRQNNQK